MLIIFKYVLQSLIYVNTNYLNIINHRKQSIKLFAYLFMRSCISPCRERWLGSRSCSSRSRSPRRAAAARVRGCRRRSSDYN